jgi:leader peptidase (prepilin peptidase)/N-methyltransferase
MFMFLAYKFIPIINLTYPLFLFTLIWYTYLWCLWLVIAVYDIRHTVIPDKLVWFANALSLTALYLFSHFQLAPHPATWGAVIAGPLLALPFWVVWFMSRGKWMGLGDAKLVLGLGWLLGASAGLLGIMLAFWIDAAFAILLLIVKGRAYSLKSQIPFGPFLLIGAFIVFSFSLTLAQLTNVLRF